MVDEVVEDEYDDEEVRVRSGHASSIESSEAS